MAKRPTKKKPPQIPSEIADFCARVRKVADERDRQPFTISEKLFGQGRAVTRLEQGFGVNSFLWVDAVRELARMEADPDYWPPTPRRIKQKPPAAGRQPVSA